MNKNGFMIYARSNILIFEGDSLEHYSRWGTPAMIMSDGPYEAEGCLSDFYEPHIAEWSRHAMPQTTLWFWCSEVGWAEVHQTIVSHGWEYRSCNIWNKGASGISGDVPSRTSSSIPVVTEVCVQYSRKPLLNIDGAEVPIKSWLRCEWERTGLPYSAANEACGVSDAATRKYLTESDVWYMPPVDALCRMTEYANLNGAEEGRPYFSLDGESPMTRADWMRCRPKFRCPYGMTNVWDARRFRASRSQRSKHQSQKPLPLVRTLVEMSTGIGDAVWEPFGGMCTAAVASYELGRACRSAEKDPDVYAKAVRRLSDLPPRLF